MNAKFIVVSFLPIYPVSFGSSVVISSFFENIPSNNKVLFQVSTNEKIKNKQIKNFYHFKENRFVKLICVIKQILNILKEIKKTKEKKIIIVEGASWIGYSFLLISLIKLLFSKIKVCYRAHSVEYEIRKKNSNYLISSLSFLFEKYVYRLSDLSTTVSKVEKKKIKSLYKVNTHIFPNIINHSKIKKNFKIKHKKYILYSGSYKYLPNKNAIDRLVKSIMPQILKSLPDIKLILTGSNKLPYDFSWIENLGMISKNKYLNILRNSLCLIVPTKEGYGTRVKIIEALCEGVIVVSSKIGIEGINDKKVSPPPFQCKSDASFVKAVIKINNSNEFKKLSNKNKNYFINKYDAKRNTIEFINKII